MSATPPEPWTEGLTPGVVAYVRAHLDAQQADADLKRCPADRELEQYAKSAKADATARWEALTEPERETTIGALALAMLARAGLP